MRAHQIATELERYAEHLSRHKFFIRLIAAHAQKIVDSLDETTVRLRALGKPLTTDDGGAH